MHSRGHGTARHGTAPVCTEVSTRFLDPGGSRSHERRDIMRPEVAIANTAEPCNRYGAYERTRRVDINSRIKAHYFTRALPWRATLWCTRRYNKRTRRKGLSRGGHPEYQEPSKRKYHAHYSTTCLYGKSSASSCMHGCKKPWQAKK